MRFTKKVVQKPRSSETRSMIEAAREEMERFKAERGIKAILPKTKNQKLELQRSNKAYRTQVAHEARQQTFGAASAVRIINPEEA